MSCKIIICGVYRSGTSYLAGKLIKSGLNMGEWISEHHEDQFIHAMNQEEMSSNPPNFNKVPHHHRPSDGFMTWLKTYKMMRDNDGDYGIKEPRIAQFIASYISIWPEAKYILCVRNPLSAIWSQRARNNDFNTDEDSMFIWLSYVGNAITVAKAAGVPFFMWNYDAEIKIEEEAMSKFLDIDMAALDFAKDFRRSEQSRQESKADTPISAIHGRQYEQVVQGDGK